METALMQKRRASYHYDQHLDRGDGWLSEVLRSNPYALMNKQCAKVEGPLCALSRSSSKIEFRRELHHACVSCEGCDSPNSATVNIPFRKSKLRCIEHVEHLPANF